MEDNKKRVRPTWAIVRGLEEEIASLRDEIKVMATDEGLMADKNITLEQSNKLMEAELKRLRGVIDEVNERCREKDDTIFRLVHRSLVDRIFNREV